MRKKLSVALTAVLLTFVVCLWLLFGGGGNTKDCERIIGASAVYTQQEIGSAMDLVEQQFRQGFEGCHLIELVYDEALSDLYAADWAAQYGADRAIVLTSIFDVGASGGDGSLNPNSTYSNWQWILTQTGQADWVLQTWGY